MNWTIQNFPSRYQKQPFYPQLEYPYEFQAWNPDCASCDGYAFEKVDGVYDPPRALVPAAPLEPATIQDSSHLSSAKNPGIPNDPPIASPQPKPTPPNGVPEPTKAAAKDDSLPSRGPSNGIPDPPDTLSINFQPISSNAPAALMPASVLVPAHFRPLPKNENPSPVGSLTSATLRPELTPPRNHRTTHQSKSPSQV